MTYSLQGTVSLLHAQTPQRPEKVKGKRFCLLPATYQQTYLDLPQYHSLPDEAVDSRPVPWHKHKNVGSQPGEIDEKHAGFNHRGDCKASERVLRAAVRGSCSVFLTCEHFCS